MRINELLIEDQETDEGVLGSIGRGVAAGLGGIAKGAGMVAGVGTGMKKAFQKGKATSAAHIAGDVPKPPKTSNPDFDAEYARLTQPAPAAQKPAATAPAAQTAAPKVDAGNIQSQIAQKQKELTDLQSQLKAAQAPAAQPAATAPAAQTAAPKATGTPMPMKPLQVPGAVTPTLKVQQGGKPAAAPAAQKPAAPTQQDIEADRERMASGTNESVKFKSNFLGMDI